MERFPSGPSHGVSAFSQHSRRIDPRRASDRQPRRSHADRGKNGHRARERRRIPRRNTVQQAGDEPRRPHTHQGACRGANSDEDGHARQHQSNHRRRRRTKGQTIPISVRRRLTAYAVTPYSPSAPSSSASAPKNIDRVATSRSCVSEASTWSARDRNVKVKSG